MELTVAPHDLLKLGDTRLIPFSTQSEPSWVARVLAETPWVVVRRASLAGELIPVGVRGKQRSERHAAFVSPEAVTARISPEWLAAARSWKASPRTGNVAALKALDEVEEILAAYRLDWGPAGSVGFELASGAPTAASDSDLDIVIRSPGRLSVQSARSLCDRLACLQAQVDALLETPGGAVSLREYARSHVPVLQRTQYGPRLVKDPWGDGE
jgi:phosphoribosyl-dephospho-CoA transferase